MLGCAPAVLLQHGDDAVKTLDPFVVGLVGALEGGVEELVHLHHPPGVLEVLLDTTHYLSDDVEEVDAVLGLRHVRVSFSALNFVLHFG